MPMTTTLTPSTIVASTLICGGTETFDWLITWIGKVIELPATNSVMM